LGVNATNYYRRTGQNPSNPIGLGLIGEQNGVQTQFNQSPDIDGRAIAVTGCEIPEVLSSDLKPAEGKQVRLGQVNPKHFISVVP